MTVRKYDAVTKTVYHMTPFRDGYRIVFRNTAHGPREIFSRSEDEFMAMGSGQADAAEQTLRDMLRS